jgi:hypothetical protein
VIDHKHCKPPRGEKIVAALRPTDKPGCARIVKGASAGHALAFLSESAIDKTTATLWIPDCSCVGHRRCPRTRMLNYAQARYDITNVMPRPAISGVKARGGR